MDGPAATRAIRAIGIITPIFGLTGKLDKFLHIYAFTVHLLSLNTISGPLLKYCTNNFLFLFGMTGNALESDVKLFLNAGVDSVLIKPFSMVDFSSAMASVAIRMATGVLPMGLN